LFLALPFLTGQIPQIGVILTPMHFPMLLRENKNCTKQQNSAYAITAREKRVI